MTDSEEMDTILEIVELSKKLGWSIGLEKSSSENKEVRGLIVGTKEYIIQMALGGPVK